MTDITTEIRHFYLRIKIHGIKKIIKYIASRLYSFFWGRMIKGSYSQKGEDLVIDRILHYKKRGFYVDIGAHDPNTLNNTKRFYNKGWSGINIEPDYNNYRKLIKDRPRDINLNIGIGNKNKILNFYRFIPDTISTFSEENLSQYKNCGFKLIEARKVRTKRLSEVFAEYVKNKTIDFISIDAEGYDLKILQSNNWNKYRPTCVCIENHYHYNDKNIFEETKILQNFMRNVEYNKVYANNINEIYVSRT